MTVAVKGMHQLEGDVWHTLKIPCIGSIDDTMEEVNYKLAKCGICKSTNAGMIPASL